MSRIFFSIRLYIKLSIKLFVILPLSVLSFGGHASQPYLEENRVAYVEKILQAFRQTKLQNIINTYRYIYAVEKNNCRSSLSDLKVECLLSFAKNNCSASVGPQSRNNCELYSDIVIVNKLSENVFIKRSERYHITRNTSDDYRTALTNRLRQKYGRIVTHFSLTQWSECGKDDLKCLAAGLDQFCLDYTNSHSLSWQYCMSASLWFIGTSK
jgi:hypothetical protein